MRSLPLLALAACGEWPRHQHLPELEPAVQAGASLSQIYSDQIAWTGPTAESADGVDGDPGAEPLGAWSGALSTGTLEGLGWDPDALVDHSELGCSGMPSHPPHLVEDEAEDGTWHGDYTGDTELWAFSAAEPGLLCATLELSEASDGGAVEHDLLLYSLDDCGLPDEPWTSSGPNPNSLPADRLGYGRGGSLTSWGVEVEGGLALGVVLAGFTSAAVSREAATVPWRLGLSLLPSGSAACPVLPEQL